jgi:hypothetical protein
MTLKRLVAAICCALVLKSGFAAAQLGGAPIITGPAGSPNPNTLSVQGIAGGTPVAGNLSQVGGSSLTLGSKTGANSIPVVIASDQGAVPVSGSGTFTVAGSVTANAGTNLNTSALALDASVNGLLLGQASTSSGQKGPLAQCAAATGAPSYSTGQTDPLSCTLAGALRVDGSAVTQPISGTVTANAGSGTFTVAGTVTSNIGTTNGLALDATLAKLNNAQGSATSGETGPLMLGAATTAAPSYTTGQSSPLSLTLAGALRVDGSAVTQPVSGTLTANQGGAPWTFNQTQIAGTAIDVNSGNKSAGTQRFVLATDQPNLTTALNVNCTIGCSSSGGSSLADEGTFTQGTTAFTVAGGIFNNSITNLTSGQAGAVQLTADRMMFTNLGKVGGSAVSLGSKTSANSIPVVIASDQGAVAVSGTLTANIGTTNGLALDTSVNGILLSQGSTTSGEKGPLMLGAVTTGAPTYTTAQSSPLSLTTAGALRVDGSAVTQPVSGTITANAGSGTFTVAGTVTANVGTTNGLALDATLAKLNNAQGSTTSGETGPLILGAVTTGAPSYTTAQSAPLSLTTAGGLRVDGSAVTQPISAASLPLPTGAATSAKQPALGTAGTPSADVITVQGAAAGTPLPVSFNGSDRNVTGSLVNPGDAVAINTQGMATVGWYTTGSWVGTLVQEVTYDTGCSGASCNWFPVQTFDSNIARNFLIPSTALNSPTGQWSNGLNNDPWITNVSGAQQFRLRAVAMTSGTVTVVLNASVAPGASPVYQTNANNLKARLSDGTNDATLTAAGALYQNMRDSAGHELGVAIQGQPTVPIIVALAPTLPTAAPTKLGVPGGSLAQPLPMTLPNGSPGWADRAQVVNLSPNPSLQCPFSIGINQTGATRLVAGQTGRKMHICGFAAVSATAQSVSLVEGTGSSCGTGTAGLYGGTTASAAWAANGGVHDLKDRIQIPMQTSGDDICLLQSGAGNVSGTLTYGNFGG